MIRILFLFILLFGLIETAAHASPIDELRECLLRGIPQTQALAVDSRLAATRYRLDFTREKGWFSVSGLEMGRNGRPTDAVQAELLPYLVGRQVSLLVHGRGETLKVVSGELLKVNLSKPGSTTYEIRSADGRNVNVRVDKDNPMNDFRVNEVGDGKDRSFLDFLKSFGLREEDFARIEATNGVYDQIKFLQEAVGHDNTAAWDKVQATILKMDSNLIAGRERAVMDDWAKPFNLVREAMKIARAAEAEIKVQAALRDGETDPGARRRHELSITTLQDQLDRASDTIGRNYLGVSEALKKLTGIANDASCTGTSCMASARNISNQLGVDVPGKEVQGEKMPTVPELKKFLEDHPVALLGRLQEERNAQIAKAFKSLFLQRPILELADTTAKNIPWINQTKAVRVLKLFYDALAREDDFPKITEILRNQGSIEDKVTQARSYAADEDFLISFARRVDTKPLFTEVMDKAPDDLKERMAAAQAKAKPLGDLPLFSPINWAYFANALIATGVSSLVYEGTKHRDQLLAMVAKMLHLSNPPPPQPETKPQ